MLQTTDKKSKLLQQRAQLVGHMLDQFDPHPQASLTYLQGEQTPFHLLIETLLSARCRDDRVNQIAPLLFDKADTPEAMIKLSVDSIREVIRPCGLSKAKAEHIWQLSKILCKQFKGQVPDNFDDLESLPGVGHKTASVVMGHDFHKPAFPVDTHIHRLAMKWKLSSYHSVVGIERDLKALWPQTLWFKRHLQMIHYGRNNCNRYLCTPQHLCLICQALKEFDKEYS